MLAAGHRALSGFERLELPLGLIASDTIAFLNPAYQLIALSADHVEIVIGEFAPLLLHLPLELFPIAFEDVLVHCCSFLRFCERSRTIFRAWNGLRCYRKFLH